MAHAAHQLINRWHGERWRYAADGYADCRAADIEWMDGIEAFDGGELVARSRTTWVRRVPLADGRAVFVKCCFYPRPFDLFLRIFSRRFWWHRAEREWRSLALLESLGFRVVRRLALAERRHLGFLRAALLVTEEFAGSTRLDHWLATKQTREEVPSAISALASWVAALHRAGFVHGDLNARNVLVLDRPDGTPDFRTIDAGRGARQSWSGIPGARHRRDLAPLVLAVEIIAGSDAATHFATDYAAAAGVRDGQGLPARLRAEIASIRNYEGRRIERNRPPDVPASW